MIPMEDEHVVSFEWIGLHNYLGEKVPRSGSRTRGANSTSADAAIMFRHNDGTRQLTLIEWKYTESYNPVYLGVARSLSEKQYSKRYASLVECKDANYSTTKSRLL